MSHEVGHIAEDDLIGIMRRGDSIERWRRGLSREDLLGISRQAAEYPEAQAFAEAFAMANHMPEQDWPPAVRRLMELMQNVRT